MSLLESTMSVKWTVLSNVVTVTVAYSEFVNDPVPRAWTEIVYVLAMLSPVTSTFSGFSLLPLFTVDWFAAFTS